MKRIMLLISFLTITFFLQAQEKINFQLNGETIEFNISQEEIFVEYAENQKAAAQRISKDGFEELSSKSAILKTSELEGTFNKRKQSLRAKTSQIFQRIEPVLIYNDGTKQIAKGELNIKLKADASINDLLKGKTFTVQPNEFDKDLYLVKLNLETSELFELVNQLQDDNRIEYAEPNFIRMMKPHTNDPFFSSQWAINNQGYLGGTIDADMDVDDAWNYTTGAGIKVAVIDEGVDLKHTDLTANLLSGYDATGGGSNGAPNESRNDAHGTACAGIIAAEANNTNGTAGVAYNAKIIPVRIAYSVSSTSTAWITNDIWIANGINWAWQNGADVLSNSYGGGSFSSTIESAINNAVNNGRSGKGSVVLFSSGNDSGGNGNPVSFPATVSSAISVGASSMCDTRKNLSSCDGEFWGSNFGNSLDIVAPGVQIYTTDISGSNGYRNGDYMPSFNGTSSACPNVAGVVALILSADPSLTQQEAREILERNTDKVIGYNYSNNSNQPNGTWNNEMGYGRVNALKAVEEAITSLTPSKPNINDFSLVSSGPSCIAYNWQFVSFGVQKNDIKGCSLQDLPENITEVEWNIIQSQPINTTLNSGAYQCTTSNVINAGVKIAFSYQFNPYVTTFLFRVKGSGGWSEWSVGHYHFTQKCDYNYSVYPNPTSEILNIQTHVNFKDKSVKNNIDNYALYDFNSTLISKGRLNNYTSIDVSKYKKGIYLLKIISEKNPETHHIIIK